MQAAIVLDCDPEDRFDPAFSRVATPCFAAARHNGLARGKRRVVVGPRSSPVFKCGLSDLAIDVDRTAPDCLPNECWSFRRAFSGWANTMGDLTPEETSETDRAARAWYEATRRARANRWGPHAFPGEDLRRLWDILNPFSWTHGGTAEKSRQRWSEGRKGR